MIQRVTTLGSLEMSLHNANQSSWSSYQRWKVYISPVTGKKKARSAAEKRAYLSAALEVLKAKKETVNVNI